MKKTAFLSVFVFSLFLYTGCGPKINDTIRICPGKDTLAESIAILNGRIRMMKSLKAKGQVRYVDYQDGQPMTEEVFPTFNLVFSPPYNLYCRADNVFGEIMRLGMNKDEFWLRIKPGEVSGYWWGAREQAEFCKQRMWLNPQNFVEAFGLVNIDQRWILSNDGTFDVLTKNQYNGLPEKKIYVDGCEYLIRRIEYFNEAGEIIVTVDLRGYTNYSLALHVPSELEIRSYKYQVIESRTIVSLNAIRQFEPTEKQLKGKLFKRPDSKGYLNIFRLNKLCEFERL